MPTNVQLQAEVDRLTAENARLREQVANATSGLTARPVPTEPSFVLSEGTRQEIAEAKRRAKATGHEQTVVDPFAGRAVNVRPDGTTSLDDELEDDDEFDDED